MTEALRNVEQLLEQGADFSAIADFIDATALTEDEQAALWLLASSGHRATAFSRP
jgi:hypothetical protein